MKEAGQFGKIFFFFKFWSVKQIQFYQKIILFVTSSILVIIVFFFFLHIYISFLPQIAIKTVT